MSRRLDCWRRVTTGLSVALVSALIVPVMTTPASAQDKGTWTAVSTMPSGTGDSAVAALDGKIYVFGGSTFRPHILPDSSDMGSGTWGSTVNYEYEPKTDTWRERAPLPIGLSHISAVALNGKLYTFGGFTNLVHKNPQTLALAYDPTTDKWQELAPMSTALGSVSVAVVDGKFTRSAAAPTIQPLPTFTKSTIRQQISGAKKRQCQRRAIIWVSQLSTAKSISSADAQAARLTTFPTMTSMIRQQTNGQRQHPCQPPAAAGRPSIIMACCSISVASAGGPSRMPRPVAARLLTRTKPTIRKRIRG
jgi:Kelch motif